MFYKTGVDITNDKQMFYFLKEHFVYPTLNAWNGLESIANNVKMYNLHLSGNWCTALSLLENGEYDTINFMIADWQRSHPDYEVYFNGRSGGYLVLCNTSNNGTILPYCIDAFDTYEDYKEYCRKEYCGSVKANRDELVFYTKLVQDFDKLCNEIRDFCDELSNLDFKVVELEKSIEEFNSRYEDDLELLGFRKLQCPEEGKVDVSEIVTFTCLFESFLRIARRVDSGYVLKSDENGWLYYTEA
jgi:hypothetical protein